MKRLEHTPTEILCYIYTWPDWKKRGPTVIVGFSHDTINYLLHVATETAGDYHLYYDDDDTNYSKYKFKSVLAQQKSKYNKGNIHCLECE